MNQQHRLKKNHDIEKLIKLRQSVGNKYYAIFFAASKNPLAQVAISPSRKFKTAVAKNYEKRVVREIIRPLLSELSFLKLLIVVKQGAGELSFAQKQEQIIYLLNKIKEQIINKEKKWKQTTKNICLWL